MVNETETLGGSLEDLYAFCAVIEFGTLSAAARERGETKGSISRRLSRLEQRLGVALLARTPRSVSATEEGTASHSTSTCHTLQAAGHIKPFKMVIHSNISVSLALLGCIQ